MTREVLGQHCELVRRGPALIYDVYVGDRWLGEVVLTRRGSWRTAPERNDAPVVHTGTLQLALTALLVEEGMT